MQRMVLIPLDVENKIILFRLIAHLQERLAGGMRVYAGALRQQSLSLRKQGAFLQECYICRDEKRLRGVTLNQV